MKVAQKIMADGWPPLYLILYPGLGSEEPTIQAVEGDTPLHVKPPEVQGRAVLWMPPLKVDDHQRDYLQATYEERHLA